MQPPVNFRNLRLRGLIQREDFGHGRLRRICHHDNKLYCYVQLIEEHKIKYLLTVYDTSGCGGTLRLLDSVQVECTRSRFNKGLAVDKWTHRVYVSCDTEVLIFRWEDNGLVRVGTLRCVKDCGDITVNSAETVFICDNTYRHERVCLIDVVTDTVISELEKPIGLGLFFDASHVSVLGQTVLVCYANNCLATYRRDSTTSPHVLQRPEGLTDISSITTDGHSSFLVTDQREKCMFVFDEQGYFCHKIDIDIMKGRQRVLLAGCAVISSQLYVGCNFEQIFDKYFSGVAVMTPH